MTGALQLTTTFLLPPGDRDVVEKLQLNGSFAIADAAMTHRAEDFVLLSASLERFARHFEIRGEAGCFRFIRAGGDGGDDVMNWSMPARDGALDQRTSRLAIREEAAFIHRVLARLIRHVFFAATSEECEREQ